MAKRWRSPKYLAAVRKLPCVVCLTQQGINAHHKTGAGMGLKAHDYETFPLCWLHHVFGGREVAIHSGVSAWEAIHGTQDSHIIETQRKLGYETPNH